MPTMYNKTLLWDGITQTEGVLDQILGFITYDDKSQIQPLHMLRNYAMKVAATLFEHNGALLTAPRKEHLITQKSMIESLENEFDKDSCEEHVLAEEL